MKINFQLNNTTFKKIGQNFTLPGLENHTLLRQFVFVDDCDYKFTIWTASTCIHGRARPDRSYPSYKGCPGMLLNCKQCHKNVNE